MTRLCAVRTNVRRLKRLVEMLNDVSHMQMDRLKGAFKQENLGQVTRGICVRPTPERASATIKLTCSLGPLHRSSCKVEMPLRVPLRRDAAPDVRQPRALGEDSLRPHRWRDAAVQEEDHRARAQVHGNPRCAAHRGQW
jgi:hypothetical protein